MTWRVFFLILHILAAIIAFGPSFAYGLIAAKGQQQPQHAAFATEVVHTIETRLGTPLAIVVPVLGVVLIFAGDHDLFASEWLLISIGLYLFAFFFAVFFMTPRIRKMLELLRSAPAQGPDGPPGPPPPRVETMGRQLQMGGTVLGILIVTILVLMVWKPGAAFS
jgi:Predicted integral membrane protein (DUF2269)